MEESRQIYQDTEICFLQLQQSKTIIKVSSFNPLIYVSKFKKPSLTKPPKSDPPYRFDDLMYLCQNPETLLVDEGDITSHFWGLVFSMKKKDINLNQPTNSESYDCFSFRPESDLRTGCFCITFQVDGDSVDQIMVAFDLNAMEDESKFDPCMLASSLKLRKLNQYMPMHTNMM